MAYTPVVLTKNGKTRTASTLEEEVELRWDGWLPTGSAAPYPRPLKELVGAEAEAAIRAAYVPSVVIAGTGIDPTGATDSASAIQAKLTAAGTGARIHFPAGTFLVSTALLPLSGQVLDGPGLLKATTTNTTAVLDLTGKTGVAVMVDVDGGRTDTITQNPGSGYVPTRHGVNIGAGSSGCRVRECHVSNVPGVAVRIVDANRNVVRSVEITNCDDGIIVGSAGSAAKPGGGSDGNTLIDIRMNTIGKNGVFLTGRTDSGSGPNPITRTTVNGLRVAKFGDTGIEVGQGSSGFALTNIFLDATDGDATWDDGWNGVLFRDAVKGSLAGFTIRNVQSYSNGNGSQLTLGNGIYYWPQYTGVIEGISVSTGLIENCTRGVFAQGNQSTVGTPGNGFNGTAGTAGVIYAGCTLSGVVVDGTQLGVLDGSYTTVLDQIYAHGFYIQSVSGFTFTGCIAKGCQNDGFRIGDINVQAAYVLDVDLIGCRAFNNGQQARTGIVYAGFNLNGTSDQQRVHLVGCRAADYQASGSKTQHVGYRWNSYGGPPVLTDCRGTGHSGTYLNGTGGATYSGVGTDTSYGVGGSITTQSGNYSVDASVSTVLWNGTATSTVTLPSATTVLAGRMVRVRNIGTVALTIAKSGGGTLSKTSLAVGEDYVFVTDGTNWY